MMTTTTTNPDCNLIPIDLTDPTQYTEIRRQRQICGWHHSPQTLQNWAQKQADGLKSFFWITIPSPKGPIRAGHISLDAYSDILEYAHDLVRADKSILTIQAFFLLPEYRAGGLGRRAMHLVEELAVREPYGSPGCRAITLTALSKRYLYEEGPEWRGVWERMGVEMPGFSIQEWYEKLGYVAWMEKPVYEERALDGGVIRLVEAFMRKEL